MKNPKQKEEIEGILRGCSLSASGHAVKIIEFKVPCDCSAFIDFSRKIDGKNRQAASDDITADVLTHIADIALCTKEKAARTQLKRGYYYYNYLIIECSNGYVGMAVSTPSPYDVTHWQTFTTFAATDRSEGDRLNIKEISIF